MIARYTRFTLACALTALLAACGGGGSAGTGPLPAPPSSSPAPVQTPNAQFVIQIPAIGTTAASSRRTSSARPMDFSASTQSVTIAVGTQVLTTADVSATSSFCKSAAGGGRTCTIGITAPTGNDVFTITAYDQANAKGNAIAKGTVAAAISTQPATVNVAVAGTIASIKVALSNPYPPVGTAATVNVVVSALDADGNVVLGPYPANVLLQDSDTSGATVLSTATIADSSTAATLTYNAAAPFISATITASMSGVSSATSTFAPIPQFLNSYVPANAPGFFPRGPGPWNITKGPDGNMWVAATGYSEIIKVAPDGSMTYYPVSNPGSQLLGIVTGSDGNLWFAEQGNNAIGKITTSGTITEYTLPGAFAVPVCVALGPDGNVWFSDLGNNVLGRIAPSGQVSEYPVPANTRVIAIAPGADGNLWMTDQGNNAILKVSTTGQILASYPIPSSKAAPYGLAAGPDGNIWFTEFGTSKIGRVTPSGTFTEFAIPSGSAGPIAIVAGPDGRMWFAEMGQEAGQGKIGYITVDGTQIRDYFGDGYHIHDLAFDASGKLWYLGLQLPRGHQEIGTFVY
ncbi:MAG TPA: hypothetical protein VJP85_13915 [Candidatus Baltobacteraceae bacterium]|nr:hypothetical protein [Candidatus Baltobacteraceae bacterium]